MEWRSPPIGFEALNGELLKGDNYHEVRDTLKAVIADDMGKAAPARKFDCAAKIITRCTEDHPYRHQL